MTVLDRPNCVVLNEGDDHASPLCIDIRPTERGGVRLVVSGEIDDDNASHLRPYLTEATDRRRPVEIDLSDVPFIDSAGLRVIVEAWASVREGGSFDIVDASKQVRRVFEVTGLDSTLAGTGSLAPAPPDTERTTKREG